MSAMESPPVRQEDPTVGPHSESDGPQSLAGMADSVQEV